MADQTSLLAIVILAVGITVHFSLHKVEEGYVGVYYRVSAIKSFITLKSYFIKIFMLLKKTL